MSENITIDEEPAPVCAPIEDEASEKRRRWFELALVLLISLGGAFLRSLYLLNYGRAALPQSQNGRWLTSVFQETTCLLLLGYVLSRRKLRIADLGLRWSFGGLGMGLLIAFASYLAYVPGYYLVHSFHYVLFHSDSGGLTASEVFAHPTIMAIPFTLLNPFFEELIVRAYLMTEVKALTGSWMLAAAMSTVLQFSYHLYYGWEQALALSFQFLVFSIYYARTRRATPIVVAHEVFDILGLIRLW